MNIQLKRFSLDRLTTFCDAVVAIALTLLVLDLKIDSIPTKDLLSWSALYELKADVLAYILSFIVISVVWSIHNQFFELIKQVDSFLFWANIVWLFFISILPFTTRLVSAFPNQEISSFIYACNAMGVALCLNAMWDYIEKHPDLLAKQVHQSTIIRIRIACNVGVINAGLAMIAAFLIPILSFLLIISRPLTSAIVKSFYRKPL